MKKKQQKIQIILILIGLLLIFATYFYYPYAERMKLVKDQPAQQNLEKTHEDNERTFFKNVEYKGYYDLNKPFTIKSEKAHLLNEEPDVVYMTNMHVTLFMDDGRAVIITSDNGIYNKISYDCFFENNVKAVDGETTVYAENLDLLATKDSATVYNNVFLTNDKGSLRADKVYYDFETKHYQVSMFNDEKVKIKLIKWAISKKNLGS